MPCRCSEVLSRKTEIFEKLFFMKFFQTLSEILSADFKTALVVELNEEKVFYLKKFLGLHHFWTQQNTHGSVFKPVF